MAEAALEKWKWQICQIFLFYALRMQTEFITTGVKVHWGQKLKIDLWTYESISEDYNKNWFKIDLTDFFIQLYKILLGSKIHRDALCLRKSCFDNLQLMQEAFKIVYLL